MSDATDVLPLRVVDARTLAAPLREALRPGEWLKDRDGRARRLPVFFYEVPTWAAANELALTPNFRLAELLRVDVREAEAARICPRYVPCAVLQMAAQLELFRRAVEAPVYIAANGGYRSPSHALTTHATPHCWGSAANIYRVGNEYLDSEERITRYNALAREVLPGVWTRPWGHGAGEADDHVHLDLGFLTVVPHVAPAEGECGTADADEPAGGDAA
jgi:hypothetical protein